MAGTQGFLGFDNHGTGETAGGLVHVVAAQGGHDLQKLMRRVGRGAAGPGSEEGGSRGSVARWGRELDGPGEPEKRLSGADEESNRTSSLQLAKQQQQQTAASITAIVQVRKAATKNPHQLAGLLSGGEVLGIILGALGLGGLQAVMGAGGE